MDPLDYDDDELFPAPETLLPGMEPGRTEPLTWAEWVQVFLMALAVAVILATFFLLFMDPQPLYEGEYVRGHYEGTTWIEGHWEGERRPMD